MITTPITAPIQDAEYQACKKVTRYQELLSSNQGETLNLTTTPVVVVIDHQNPEGATMAITKLATSIFKYQ